MVKIVVGLPSEVVMIGDMISVTSIPSPSIYVTVSTDAEGTDDVVEDVVSLGFITEVIVLLLPSSLVIVTVFVIISVCIS